MRRLFRCVGSGSSSSDSCGQFDMEFCLGEYDDSRAAGVDPLKHNVKRGYREDGEFERTGSHATVAGCRL